MPVREQYPKTLNQCVGSCSAADVSRLLGMADRRLGYLLEWAVSRERNTSVEKESTHLHKERALSLIPRRIIDFFFFVFYSL
uniref:Uncharacterized protein n=1 Tax=Manihot esculenta TaxID=3983 RepID=A0A2C9W8B6_MANES